MPAVDGGSCPEDFLRGRFLLPFAIARVVDEKAFCALQSVTEPQLSGWEARLRNIPSSSPPSAEWPSLEVDPAIATSMPITASGRTAHRTLTSGL